MAGAMSAARFSTVRQETDSEIKIQEGGVIKVEAALNCFCLEGVFSAFRLYS